MREICGPSDGASALVRGQAARRRWAILATRALVAGQIEIKRQMVLDIR